MTEIPLFLTPLQVLTEVKKLKERIQAVDDLSRNWVVLDGQKNMLNENELWDWILVLDKVEKYLQWRV